MSIRASMTGELSPRAAQILMAIVQTYIQTGRPVASLTISRKQHHRLSPATIRNVMAELAEAGYLSQPHPSAGRIPTTKAFEFFVRSVQVKRLLASELERLKRELSQASTVEDRLERTSHLLTEMTRSMGIAAAIPTESQVLERIELLDLGFGRVLMVVVTQDKVVRDRVVVLDEPISQLELTQIRNFINEQFRGQKLADIRHWIQSSLQETRAAYDAIVRKLLVLYRHGLLDLELAPEVHVGGTAHLLGMIFHLTRERLRALLETLEQKERILQLLDQFLGETGGQVTVRVGLSEIDPAMQELALIGLSVSMSSGLIAKLAVLGPLRMDYHKVMSAVVHLGEALQSTPM